MPERVTGGDARGLAWTLSRLLLIVALVSALVVIDPGVADAKKVPETLADRRPAQVGVVEVDFPIDFVAITWYASDDQIDAHAHGNGDPESNGAVRFRNDGVWGRWTPFHEDGAQAEAQWSSSLVSGADADAYQIRGVPAWAGSPRAMAINTTDGPLATVDSRSRGAADSLSNCVSRAEWGADESYRFIDGVESWPTTFFPVQGLIVHHTVTLNEDPSPAATVRAIYYQHAVGNDWGDIGYNYLIDEAGSIYEGRWSGAESTACGAGGNGADFAHNQAGDLVTGGHTAYHNQGNAGIALLGNFASPVEYPEDPTWIQVDPKPAALAALNGLLVELVKRHVVDPTGMIDYANPMCDLPSEDWEWDCSNLSLPYFPGRGDPARFKDAISGHRDWKNTACPGASLYALLAGIRIDIEVIVIANRPIVAVAQDPLVVEGDTTGGYGGPIGGVSASDPNGDSVKLTNDGPGVLPLGNTVVTWTASDPDGWFDTATQVVSVVDTTPPILTIPKDLDIEDDGEADVTAEFSVGVVDIVDAAPTLQCVPASGSVFATGLTTVTCEGEDASGNKATAMFEVVVVPINPFTDDDGSVFEADIAWMAAVGITKGCNPPVNDRYCPDSRVTRGQMAAFLVRALDLTERLDNPFADDDGSIFEADIERLAAAGITKGCNPPTNDRFCPDGNVTREQMAAFLVRALGYTNDGGGDLFIDDDDSIFETDIDRLGTASVTKGCNPPTNDRYCPSGYVTRGQMAAFLHRALG